MSSDIEKRKKSKAELDFFAELEGCDYRQDLAGKGKVHLTGKTPSGVCRKRLGRICSRSRNSSIYLGEKIPRSTFDLYKKLDGPISSKYVSFSD